MGKQRILIIAFGTMAMFLLMYLRRKNYPQIKIWKMAVISLLLTFSGVAGAMLMFFIESGSFGGTSFFGSILFVPIIILPAILLKISYGELMDLCAPAESLMLAFMKFDCLLSGCCIGKYLPSLEFQFPSQIVEMVVTLVIVALLLKIENNPDNKNTLYGWYLIFYGATRFVLNWFRYGVKPFVWILPAGNFWSIIAVITGVLWVQIIKCRKKKVN
ncbi:MAG: prolipoprotein diacylglyceryl transferase [Oscillospiraceae bacterium]|nr:prolipoprotein diacylglyceryl transferase [Oscillospiraceae bacterium]MBQ6849485.1 prolipoprotein diacylglyceryl transferase [Oscillospiraceae bacterium]